MAEDYAAASLARRHDVRVLTDGGRELAAIYMVGYVAECRLKALLRTRRMAFPRSGSAGHDLRALWAAAGFKLRDAGEDGATFLAIWTTALRYEADVPPHLDRNRLMQGATAACDFVNQRHKVEQRKSARRQRRGA